MVLRVADDGTLGPVEQRVARLGQPGPHRVEQPFSKPARQRVVRSEWSLRLGAGQGPGPNLRLTLRRRPPLTRRDARRADARRRGAAERGVQSRRQHLYAVNELDSTLTACRFDTARGALSARQRLPLLADTYTGNSRAAGIAISGDGRHLDASNRGSDTIEWFAIDAAARRLAHRGSRATEDRTPRFFARCIAAAWSPRRWPLMGARRTPGGPNLLCRPAFWKVLQGRA